LVVGRFFSALERFVGFASLTLQFDLGELWASFQTATAAHALAEGVVLFLVCSRNSGTSTHIVGTVNRHPRFNSLQIIKQSGTIDEQIPQDGKLGHRPKFDLLSVIFEQSVYQRAAALSHASINNHGA
jgi:hypothetical protein